MDQQFAPVRNTLGVIDDLKETRSYQAKTGFDSFSLAFFLVVSTYCHPLLIFKNGNIHRARYVALLKFFFRSDIDYRKGLTQL